MDELLSSWSLCYVSNNELENEHHSPTPTHLNVCVCVCRRKRHGIRPFSCMSDKSNRRLVTELSKHTAIGHSLFFRTWLLGWKKHFCSLSGLFTDGPWMELMCMSVITIVATSLVCVCRSMSVIELEHTHTHTLGSLMKLLPVAWISTGLWRRRLSSSFPSQRFYYVYSTYTRVSVSGCLPILNNLTLRGDKR